MCAVGLHASPTGIVQRCTGHAPDVVRHADVISGCRLQDGRSRTNTPTNVRGASRSSSSLSSSPSLHEQFAAAAVAAAPCSQGNATQLNTRLMRIGRSLLPPPETTHHDRATTTPPRIGSTSDRTIDQR